MGTRPVVGEEEKGREKKRPLPLLHHLPFQGQIGPEKEEKGRAPLLFKMPCKSTWQREQREVVEGEGSGGSVGVHTFAGSPGGTQTTPAGLGDSPRAKEPR